MIRLEGIVKTYGPRVLFQNINYQFPLGARIALVGANGAGKTTLLNIICGLDDSDSGVVIRPKQLNLGYLPQEPNPNPAANVLQECLQGAQRLQELLKRMDTALERMTAEYSDENFASFEKAESAFRDAGGLSLESRGKGILSGLGFPAAWLDRSPKSLSGGWRMRLELARIFINEPDFLVLDEPTNHLDLPSLVWVEKYLQSFPGTLIFVSHDRALLNRLANYTLHLQNGKVTPYTGNFDSFLEQREARMAEEEAQADVLKKRRQSLELFISRFGAQATKARQAQSKAKVLARIKDLEGSLNLDEDDSEVSFSLPTPPSSGKEVLKIEGGSIGYTEVLSRGINLKAGRGQKIAIIGANGIGKSTLLKTIAEHVDALAGTFTLGHNVTLAYFAQDQLEILDENASILDNVKSASTSLTDRQARSLLGSFLFRGDDVFKQIRVLSGGEKSRVGLARLLVQNANLLLLDEPTNHLDMSSADILADAVSDFEGTVIFVSHDRTFIDNTCTHVFAMLPDGRSSLFEGKLDDYERLAAISDFPNVLQTDGGLWTPDSQNADKNQKNGKDNNPKTLSEASRAQQQNDKKERQRLERLQVRLDEQMAQTAKEIAKTEAALAALDGTNFNAQRTLQEQHNSLTQQLSDAENEWLKVSEQLMEIQS